MDGTTNNSVMSGADFGMVLIALKNGLKAARSGWNGKNMWIALQVPNSQSMMRRPYIYMCPVDGEFVPWVASQSDMLATDWRIF